MFLRPVIVCADLTLCHLIHSHSPTCLHTNLRELPTCCLHSAPLFRVWHCGKSPEKPPLPTLSALRSMRKTTTTQPCANDIARHGFQSSAAQREKWSVRFGVGEVGGWRLEEKGEACRNKPAGMEQMPGIKVCLYPPPLRSSAAAVTAAAASSTFFMPCGGAV